MRLTRKSSPSNLARHGNDAYARRGASAVAKIAVDKSKPGAGRWPVRNMKFLQSTGRRQGGVPLHLRSAAFAPCENRLNRRPCGRFRRFRSRLSCLRFRIGFTGDSRGVLSRGTGRIGGLLSLLRRTHRRLRRGVRLISPHQRFIRSRLGSFHIFSRGAAANKQCRSDDQKKRILAHKSKQLVLLTLRADLRMKITD